MPTMTPSVTVESFGYLHGPAPRAHLTLDLRELLYNPHTDPAMRELTGLDPAMRKHVLDTLGARGILSAAVRMVEALLSIQEPQGRPVRVTFGCAGGRHRSVVMAEELFRILAFRALRPEVLHRDILRPVVNAETLAGTVTQQDQE